MTETSAAPAARATRRTQKFLNRQAAILKAAVALINHKGVKGMTLADVAAQLDIVPTGVIYYFPSKEVLAAACFGAAIEAHEALIAEAARQPTPRLRLRRFVETYVERARDVALGKADRLAVFNDVRALGDAGVNTAYTEMFRHARALIAPEPPPQGAARQAINAATHLTLSQLFWSVVWLPLYEPDDYGRAAERLADLIENGLAAAGAPWPDAPDAPGPEPSDDVSRETFLRAATEIINEHGYLGASVDKISARLNVTKGSFYHHNEAKDDLVVACFQRTLDVMRQTQRQAILAGGDGWRRTATAAVSLIHRQATHAAPLLRTSALTSAPEAMQRALVAEFDRVSLTFASTISDGIADGSIRPVDAHIAAQALTAAINAAAELEYWAPGPSQAAAEAYARALLTGVGAFLA